MADLSFNNAPHKAHQNVGPKIGEWNILEASIGQRGMGKSTWQMFRARELVKQAGGHAYVIGHSLGARLPKTMPAELGGGELPIAYYSTVADLAKGLRRHPTRWHILAPPLTLTMTDEEIERTRRSTCDELIRYSAQLSQALRDRAYEREHPLEMPRLFRKKKTRNYDGIRCPAVIIVVDEGIAVESAGKGDDKAQRKKRDWFLEWIYSLRHLHTALLYAIQNANARNWQILSEATAVYCFRVKHQWAINAVQAAGGSSYEMDQVRKLGPHEHIKIEGREEIDEEDEDEDDAANDAAGDAKDDNATASA